jgi:single-stranded DNA-specific DHH superfamily exonuclease
MQFKTGSEKRFFEFVSNLNEKDKIAILSHTDLDGITSAVISAKVLGRVDFVDFVDYKFKMFAPYIDKLKKMKINKILILDLSSDTEEKYIKKLESFTDILIIDHHEFQADLNSEKTIMIKTKGDIPACYVCYYLFSKIQKVPSWIPAIGMISDLPNKYDKENSVEVFQDFNLGKKEQDIWKYVENTNLCLKYFSENRYKIYQEFLKAKEIKDLKKLEKYIQPIKKEIQKYTEKFKKDKKVHKNLVLFELFPKPKYRIKSTLINYISLKDKNKVYVFISENSHLSISVRCQNKRFNCDKLLKKATKDIPESNSGGHIAAAGAQIPKKYLEKFKKNLIKEYEKLEKRRDKV